jgi:iron complex transport system ATP-binding protein
VNAAVDWRGDEQQAGQLAVQDVYLSRGGRRVLQAVSLRAQPGRLLALVGPNGAGKSSLLGILAGVIAPSMGSASLDGIALPRWPAAGLARRRAMLSQNVQLGFPFRVEEVVMLGRSPHMAYRERSDDHRIVDAVLRAAHAWHLRGRSYAELSGGEQRRVQLARVLAQVWEGGEGPPWLLLDEPEASLDIAHQHLLLQQVRTLSQQGWGVVAVLHDLNLAARYADDVALLAQGQLIRHGNPALALDPQTLSTLYGLPLRRVPLDGGGWMLAPT